MDHHNFPWRRLTTSILLVSLWLLLALSFVASSQSANKEVSPQAEKLVSEGNAALNRGDFAQALAAFQRAANVAEQLGDKRGMVLALNLAAGTHNYQHNYDAAL